MFSACYKSWGSDLLNLEFPDWFLKVWSFLTPFIRHLNIVFLSKAVMFAVQRVDLGSRPLTSASAWVFEVWCYTLVKTYDWCSKHSSMKWIACSLVSRGFTYLQCFGEGLRVWTKDTVVLHNPSLPWSCCCEWGFIGFVSNGKTSIFKFFQFRCFMLWICDSNCFCFWRSIMVCISDRLMYQPVLE